MEMENSIAFLLSEACPSIKYRIKQVLNLHTTPEEVEHLRREILQDGLVGKFISLQGPDGWIDCDFHSEKGVETAVRVLCEKGIEPTHPAVANMLEQLELRDETFDHGSLFRVGKILDELHLGGSQLIKAVIFAYAGIEDKYFIKEQVEKTLDVFRFVIEINKITDITIAHKGRLVFKRGVKWPSIYHLRLLAYTSGWKISENYTMITKAIKKLMELSPIPSINGLYKSQIVAPGSFCMHEFDVDFDKLESKDWMMWFHRMELLARLGVIKNIAKLESQVKQLKQSMKDNTGIYSKKINHYYFKRWGPYSGMALERDWKCKNRYLSDIIFRGLLIIHYADMIK